MGRKNRMEESIEVKMLISADAEGITGIFKRSQVTPSKPDCGQLHSLMAHDVGVAVRGVFVGGATKVTVNDSHNYDGNILLVDLSPWASPMFNTDRSLIVAEGLTEQVGVLILVGYHSRKGTKDAISYTYYYPIVADVIVNSVPFGGVKFVLHMAGYYEVPIVSLVGDGCVTVSTEKQIPGACMTVIERMIDNRGTQLYCPEKTGRLIEEVTKAAVGKYWTIALVKLKSPMTFTITFAAVTQTVRTCKVPGFTLSKGQDNVMSYTYDDYLEFCKTFLDALRQAAAFNDQC